MSSAGAVKTVKITINEVELEVPSGELIVESVKRLGLEIPVFCYHPRMEPVGMCRMCLVEVGFKQADGSVRMMPKPQAGCTLPASEGMVIATDSQSVHKDRKGVLEFLLANHPLDCPICDRGGECPLQNNTLAYGPSTSRFIELKRHLPKAFPLSQYVTLDLERCIQCGRCVRFTEEISGEAELAFRFRGADMQPSTFQLTDFESKFSGNVIEICPVGALTSAKYRFRARPWDLETSPAVCTECSNGCNVWFDHRAGKFVRINGRINEGVNEEWTCDKGKFGHDYYNSQTRLTTPLVRKGEGFVASTWAEAYEAIVAGFERPGSEIAGLTGGRVSNEGLALFQNLIRDVFKSDNLDHRWTKNPGSSSVASKLVDFETAKTVVIWCTRLADDLPIAFLRLRKAAKKKGVKVVLVTYGQDEAAEFASSVVVLQPGQEVEAARALTTAPGGPTGPMSDLQGLLSEGTILLSSHACFDSTAGVSALAILQEACSNTGAVFNCWTSLTNGMGAERLGVLPGPQGQSTDGIIAAAGDGRIKALWLVECDPTGLAGAEKALETAEFVVYQGTCENPAMAFASVVLPMAAPAEQDGTWTNCEGRVQRMEQAIRTPGESKPAWRIFSEAILRLQPSTPFFNAGEVFSSISHKLLGQSGVKIDDLAGEGAFPDLEAAPSLVGGKG